ncbi:PGAP1-like protein [Lysobacter enzymogenes]|uniref:PGAP1-like protein n=1 Tax=Lysobacter enzymogenes TaxID=69 RepID=A0A0S2DN55_LYSEN|nr:alpha/beta hydrolase [Lysobacter enzymogenes]ALN59859.1 PGAP1-like protein [Lysobacter enzymogenes]
MAAVLLCALAIWLWPDPYRVVLADYARQRWQAGLTRSAAKIDDHRWVYAYNDDAPANAPTVVMIHGFTGSKENWYPLAQRLRGRYRLFAPDLPGWGESERKAGGDYGFLAQSARVARFIEQVARKPGSEVVLLGHSMGGGIVALTTARHPHDVDRMGLFDAAGVRFNDNAFGLAVLRGKNPFAVDDAASLQRYIDIVFYDDAAKPVIPWPASRIYIDKRRRDAAFEQSVLDKIGRSDERFLPGIEAAGIRQPSLLLWCAQDVVIDPSALDLYAARLPQAQRVLLQGCGHMSIVERPQQAAEAVNRLITEARPR